MEMEFSTSIVIFDLPWEDILCRKILPFLSIKDICRMQMVNKSFKTIVEMYFTTCHVIDLRRFGTENLFSYHNFARMTRNSENLRELNLQQCKRWLKDDVLIPVVRNNCLLKAIDISGCLDVTNNAIKAIALSCKRLQKLVLQECRWLESDALKMIGNECHDLQFLSLTGCWNINNDSLRTVFRNNKTLRHVDVGDCYGVDSGTISDLAKQCSEVTYLGMKGCWRIKNDAVRLLGEYCKNLKELHIKDCKDVTEASLAILRVNSVLIDIPKPKYYYQPIELSFEEQFRSWPPLVNPQI